MAPSVCVCLCVCVCVCVRTRACLKKLNKISSNHVMEIAKITFFYKKASVEGYGDIQYYLQLIICNQNRTKQRHISVCVTEHGTLLGSRNRTSICCTLPKHRDRLPLIKPFSDSHCIRIKDKQIIFNHVNLKKEQKTTQF